MKKVIIVLFSITLLACKDNNSEKEYKIDPKQPSVKSKISAGKPSKNSSLKIEKEQTTTIVFDKYIHDFGNVIKGSANKYTFRFKNIGSVPCIIKKTKASCGCTVPKKPEKPILPNEYGEIEVVFKPKSSQVGHEINKTITVNANTIPSPIKLNIQALVVDGIYSH